jgi:hypothetical protein
MLRLAMTMVPAFTTAWPTSAGKLIYINVLSTMLSISWAVIGSAISAGGVLTGVGFISEIDDDN